MISTIENLFLLNYISYLCDGDTFYFKKMPNFFVDIYTMYIYMSFVE